MFTLSSVVETATTVVCPYATVKTNSGVVTSVIESTTYVSPILLALLL